MNCGIYKILNLANGKFYVGSATNFDKRWGYHKWVLKNNSHTNSYLQRAWNKYGEDAFEFMVLEYCDKEKLADREQHWMNETKCCSLGYNILKLAYSPIGSKRTKETCAKIGASQKGKIMSEEAKEKISDAKRQPDKWPCVQGSKCKCHKCNYRRSEYSLAWTNAKKLKEAQNVQA